MEPLANLPVLATTVLGVVMIEMSMDSRLNGSFFYTDMLY